MRRTHPVFISCLLGLFLYISHASVAWAVPAPSAPKIPAKGYILLDYHSGKLLAESNADERLEPASLTKMMTAYIAVRELIESNIKLTDKVTVSEKAWRTQGSRMFIEVNKQVSVEKLLQGIIIQSGNDASVAMAEYIAGSEETFAELMNTHAARLGMASTNFENSTGLPSDNHYSTARDMATLARAVITESPDYYAWYSQKEFSYNDITQYNRNKLLWRDKSVDGLKTGHTESAGYCLVTSAKRDGMRLISVVMGTGSEEARAKSSQSLLNYGFRFFETHKLYTANEPLTQARIWKGSTDKLPLGLAQDLYVTINRNQYKNLKATLDIKEKLMAPAEQGKEYGTLTVRLDNQDVTSKPLVALQSVAQGDLWQRLVDEAKLLLE